VPQGRFVGMGLKALTSGRHPTNPITDGSFRSIEDTEVSENKNNK